MIEKRTIIRVICDGGGGIVVAAVQWWCSGGEEEEVWYDGTDSFPDESKLGTDRPTDGHTLIEMQ